MNLLLTIQLAKLSADLDKTYEELLRLNDLHDTLMFDAFFGKWTVSKLFNILPTESRKRMQTSQKGWKKLNHDVIARAKAVWASLCFYPFYFIFCLIFLLMSKQGGIRSPAKQIYKGVELGDMSETEVRLRLMPVFFFHFSTPLAPLSF